MAKLTLASSKTQPGQEEYLFFCPGCQQYHAFVVKWDKQRADNYRTLYSKEPPTWTFNNDFQKPTFKPSLLYFGTQDAHIKHPRCHLFLTDGILQYLSDCEHRLAGQNIPLSDEPEN